MSRQLLFENADGQQLAAQLEAPDGGRTIAHALFAHCFTCGRNLKAARHISRALAARGIAVLRFNFTGLGDSEGSFADTNFSSNVDDLEAAARFMEDELGPPRILVGHSLGGSAVLRVAARLPSVRAVVTIGAPADPAHVKRLLGPAAETIEADGVADVTLGGRSFSIKKQFLDDLEQTRMEESIRSLRRALLVLHSPVDEIVGIDDASRIYQAALHPKSFVSLDRADHLLSDPSDSAYVGSVIAAWAGKYLENGGVPERAVDAATEDEWVVVETGKGYTTEVRAGAHRLLADEPVDLGGGDRGPTPYDLLLASLGACTSITLRMYADRKGWPLESVRIRLVHEKIHAEECAECETSRGWLDRIEREIDLRGDLDPGQRRRLMEIADRCPVHRTLNSEVSVRTRTTGE